MLPQLESLGFNARVGSADLGTVSAIKLCRSVVMKGIEGLVVESLLAARGYGVEREVLASLEESYPGLDWEKQPTWCWSRVVQHGGRRAEEMRGELRAQGAFDGIGGDAAWLEMADRIEAELRETGERAAQGSMP